MSVFLYFITTRLYYFFILLASVRNKKARSWIRGRKRIFDKISHEVSDKEDYIWIHSASLGEYESGKLLIENLKIKSPGKKIILTLFSPSGYEQIKNNHAADLIFYLPFDGPSTSRKFINIIQPSWVVFMKYDYWYFYLRHLHKRNIPVFMVSAVFHSKQIFFRFYGSLYRKMLSYIQKFYVQDLQSETLLKKLGIKNTMVMPDTRIDRVIEIKKESIEKQFPLIEMFKGAGQLFVCGSSYETEEKFISQLINEEKPEGKFILAPHIIDQHHIKQIRNLFGDKACYWSELSETSDIAEFKILVIDKIGLLKYIYQYADIVVIGGGFNQGIHNTLEPAVFGLPILFGPKDYEKFSEARELLARGGAFLFRNYDEFKKQFLDLNDPEFRNKTGEQTWKYIHENTGASDKIAKDLLIQIGQ